MKAYISIDLEGLPGISSLSQVSPGLSLYPDARKIMTWMARVFSKALLENGFEEVVISDSHGFMANIDYMEVDGRVSLIQGYPRPYSMVLGVEETDAALFVGYHPAAGTIRGFLDHTYSSKSIQRVYINGEAASEFYLNALYAGSYNIPIILVAGDSSLEKEVERLSPETVFVELKRGLSRNSAYYPSKTILEEKVFSAVKEAVKKYREGAISPVKLDAPINVKVELRGTTYADMAELIPGAKRVDAYTLYYEAKDGVDVLKFIELVAWIGAGASYLIQAIYK